MKYVLKKDLPFAKAGDELIVGVGYIYRELHSPFVIGLVGDLGKLISEGWIEEVKPREWWVLKPKDHSTSGGNIRFYPNPGYARYDYEKEINKNWFEIIKVREVL